MTTGAYAQLFGTTEALKNETECRNALAREFVTTHPVVGMVDLGTTCARPATVAATRLPASRCARTVRTIEARPPG